MIAYPHEETIPRIMADLNAGGKNTNSKIGETPQGAFIRKLRQERLCGMFRKEIERWST